MVGRDHGDSTRTDGTLGEAGGLGAPATRPSGTLWRLLSAAQQPAPCDHPHATPARRGRGGDGHRVASLELGTTAEARLCTGYGTLSLVSAGGAADHRGHHARRGDPKDPPASDARGGPPPLPQRVSAKKSSPDPPPDCAWGIATRPRQPSSGPESVVPPRAAGWWGGRAVRRTTPGNSLTIWQSPVFKKAEYCRSASIWASYAP